MSAAAAHPGVLADLLAFWATWWWAILLFGGSVLEWLGEACDVGLTALGRRSKRRHKRRLELKRLELEIAQTKAGTVIPAAKVPGECVHRRVVPVIAADETLTAWLCKGCDTQLPADWAVREEDL